jgi:hypothetical protein
VRLTEEQGMSKSGMRSAGSLGRNHRMKRLWITCSFLILLSSLPAKARGETITIWDTFVGGKNINNWDSLGGANFDVSRMVVGISGNLSVRIYTPFVTILGTSAAENVGLGDLFISTNGWQPFGTSPYYDDTWANSKQWEYALKFDSYPTSGASGGMHLFSVNENGIVLSWIDNPGGTYREGQEVRYNPVGGDATGLTGTWSITGGADPYLEFTVPLSYGPLQGVNDFGFHWTMTCGNDVIEGEASAVPEPASIILFATGLLAIAYLVKNQISAHRHS